MPRKLALLVALLAAALAVVSAPAGAETVTRATLTWDTDDTDIDLHVWDEDGNHAYFADQQAIPGSELDTDVLFGFGPENQIDYWGEDRRTYTYGVCYFASHQAGVPETVASVELHDPDGTVRTLKRRLRNETDAFLLGTSPSGASGYQPAPGWCRGNRTVYGPNQDGGVGQPGDGGGPGGNSYAGCARTRRRIGVVEVCADSISGGGSNYRLTGNVRLNGSVGVDGPVNVNTSSNAITSDGPVVLSEVRNDTTIPVAAGALSINTASVKEPISGRDGLAKIELGTPELKSFSLAGLEVSLSSLTGGKLGLYLDSRDGGGLIAASKIALPIGGKQFSADEVAVGIHGTSGSAVRLLGGTVKFGELPLGAWKISGLSLTYAEATDTWTAAGGFATPAFGLDVTGSLVKGRLNSIGVSVSRDVPLGQTGFILSSVGGSIEGLAEPPLKLALTASGRWGSLPGAPQVGLIHLKGVKLEVSLDGKVSLGGDVSFLLADGSPVTGKLQLGFAIDPFEASGSLGANAHFGPVDVQASATMKMNAQHFTAAGGATGQLRGLKLADARGVLSDKGIGASGEVCLAGVLGHCAKRATLGVGMAWNKFPSVEWIGAETGRYATIARKNPPSIEVARGRPLLLVDASGATQVPVITLRSPSGRRYSSLRKRADSAVVTDPALHYAGLTILAPEPGRWRVLSATGGGQTRVVTRTVRRVTRVTPKAVAPRTTSRKPLRPQVKTVKASWTSAGLPRGTHVAVYVTPDRRALGNLVASGRPPRGGFRIPRAALARGANWVRLVTSRDGIDSDQVRFSKPIWVR